MTLTLPRNFNLSGQPILHLRNPNISLKSGCKKKPVQIFKMSTEGGQQNKNNIIDSSGGVLDKYTKHRFFTALVLEIRASVYSTPSDAILISKF